MTIETVTDFPRKAALARLQTPADQARNVHFYVALSGDTLDDMQRPGYFDSLASRLRRYDRVEVVSDDDKLFAEFLVVESSNLMVRVVLMRSGEFNIASPVGAPGAAMRRDAELHVQYRGPYLKWCAMRGEEIFLRDKFETEALANQWLADHGRTTAKGAA